MHCIDKTCIPQVFERIAQSFSRGMFGLRAARLKQVVVSGGVDDGGNVREEVSVNFINHAGPVYVQVLQYDGTAGTWSETGKMETARGGHAVVEVDRAVFCPVGPTNKSQLSTPKSPSLLSITISSSFYPYPTNYPINYRCCKHCNLYIDFKMKSNNMGSADK